MKKVFLQSPAPIKSAAIIMAAYPIAISIYTFRLYAHPKNPDAWLIMGVFEAAYLLVAHSILKGSQIARWFCVIWVFVNLGLGIARFDRFSGQPSWQAFVIIGWAIQITVIALLFFPSSRLHFRKKEPNQSLQTTIMAVTDAAAQPPRQP